uniref:2Fe-2S ferredoxin-type domain-containing protein n=1 Tax=Aureoumbra lagunensis TaxID=44058 RepID=A0A7S3JQC4_9STRA|mmetsp:Transcript_17948/g.23383  ORF Transcript_17948/g.23383 Transcript_17948/m.23383 type:complete len:157 (+) Transcript_17948:50-520(+)|eukprot:CAMPEP_0197317814 /NCGR_PEP_ID=MMETSP0891-20130614/48649_1 /TAXON_ID=44058 ORGANISM="Aureoumbra lagunensis, Strain CCMP1510" /NCGR_SAMPLE_ID=MMETSP0891 /ASSEMBLY_ACC=CAM_ASM_000534 /LENGTH=156 /DNA_ID=CAMNT_0042807989 /DNA_START=25 /DNA_END=495 /DNA_ORIENTATION=-
MLFALQNCTGIRTTSTARRLLLSSSGMLSKTSSLLNKQERRRLSGTENEETVGIAFVDSHGKETSVRAVVGKTVLDAALANDIDIEAACGGEMACSTCHVILQQDNFDHLEKPTEEEQDMLDLAWGLTDTSRLCCQIKVTPELDGYTFTLPEEPSL